MFARLGRKQLSEFILDLWKQQWLSTGGYWVPEDKETEKTKETQTQAQNDL